MRGRIGGLMTSQYEVSFKDDENVPELDSVYGCTALWIYIFLKAHWIIYSKRVNFVVCEMYFNKAVTKVVIPICLDQFLNCKYYFL